MAVYYHKTSDFSSLVIFLFMAYEECSIMKRKVADMDNMTALVSTFARAYHYRNSSEPVFADNLAEQMLTEEEYMEISRNMAAGIAYFAPGFAGTREEALRFIVDCQLAPSVLARSAFCERAISNAVRLGCGQIVVFACGYDTFSLRTGNRDLTVYELDRPEMIGDRRNRIASRDLLPACRVETVGCDLAQSSWRQDLLRAGFRKEKSAFGSLLGISYYLSKEEFQALIGGISSLWSEGSSLCFDYPLSEDGTESGRNRKLAAAAGERMKAKYTYEELETLLADAGFLIYEHLDAEEATEAFFRAYNEKNAEHEMAAPKGVSYCLAVKK